MPLSEHEQRILAEIEQQLASEDPDLVARARRRSSRSGMSRAFQLRLAIALGLIGVVATALLGFIAAPWGIVSAALGLAMIFGAILLGVTAASVRNPTDRVGVPPDEHR